MSDKNGELMPFELTVESKESKDIAIKKEKQKSKQQIIENVRLQVVNGLKRNIEVKMILETAYRSRGIAKTSIGFIVFETNKYGANGFDVLEIVPFDDKDAIDRNIDNIKRIK